MMLNIQLANVISDLSGTTGQAIVRAILNGERDPQKLAELRDRRIRATKEEIAKSLQAGVPNAVHRATAARNV